MGECYTVTNVVLYMCAHTGSYAQCMLEGWSHPVGIRYECLRTDWQHIMCENVLLLRGGIHTTCYSCTTAARTSNNTLISDYATYCLGGMSTLHNVVKVHKLWRIRRHCWQMTNISGSEHTCYGKHKVLRVKGFAHHTDITQSEKWTQCQVELAKRI